jgi:hypothetical protein
MLCIVRSTMATVTLPKNFEASEISFDTVKKNAMGGKVVYMKYNGESKITIQTPLLSAPFGISTFTDDKTGVTKHSLDISFKGMNEDPKIAEFLEKMSSIDQYMITEGCNNSKDWFGKSMKVDVVEALYRPLVKPSKDESKYAPTMKLKIPSKDGRLLVEAYDHTKNEFDLNSFVPGSRVQAIIECSSIWFVNKQFGVSWRLVQVKVSKPDKLAGFSFVDDDDDDDDDDDVVVNGDINV